MEIDKAGWSGDGDLTARMLDALAAMDAVTFLRVEDAPATRAEAGFNFLSNEIYVRFRDVPQAVRERWLGIVPVTRHRPRPAWTLEDLAARLTAIEAIGEPDYGDDGMLQYLRSERIVPRFQTKGYKLVELVRIYRIDPATAGSR